MVEAITVADASTDAVAAKNIPENNLGRAERLAPFFRDLTAHKETRVRSGYALLVDKGGPKFRESDPDALKARPAAG